MTTQQDQLVDIAKRGQEAVTAALATWSENVQKFAGTVSAGPSTLPELREIVDGLYDFAHQLLVNQREFAKSVLAASTEATQTVVSQAREATETVVNQTVEVAKATGERASSAARAARNSVKA